MTVDLPLLLPGVIETAKNAGNFIAREKRNFSYESVEKKRLNDLVSYVDKEAERMIVDGLEKLLPGSGFITEEETSTRRAEFNWIIDPLDGTTNFIHGIPAYAASIGLEVKGEIVLGVVHEVTRDETFSAIKNGGAFLNDERIHVSARSALAEALVGTGFPIYNFSRLDHFLEAMRFFMKHTHGVRRIGAASVDLCYLACGRLDAFFEYNLNAWDVAAGGLIVAEAGGLVQDFSGGRNWLFGKEIACTNGRINDEFLKALQQIFTA